ncbi:MAG: hypothetical protein F2934_10420 [Actinobacteria bacterium]|nr:hypothetical protein [Actinomycetota bacterium]MSY12960.1 hypothetical protein [Actinomycetota bacterium]MSZ04189.1 hypothetical protein [Actinomycetota bacterium]MTB07529.1 hypothetical protein [Actinomycetota bacterium]
MRRALCGINARRLVLIAPTMLILWMGWQHRWTADDAFINFRIVKQLENGHGLVFNIGDRVEAGTSPLWIFILATLDKFLPITLEWIAAIVALGSTVLGLRAAIAGTQQLVGRTMSTTTWTLPIGALIYVALPPAWDFATSGLESGLSVLWIGCSWYLLARHASRDAGRPPTYLLPVLLSLGPLIRPDFAVITIVFLAGVLTLSGRDRSRLLRLGIVTFIVPVVYEVFRAGYFGNLVPNTAIAKEGSSASWHQGWLYLCDLIGTYRLFLVVPAALLVFGWNALRRYRRPQRHISATHRAAITCLVAGLLHGLLIVRVGGDFMHGRLLLPSLLLLLLPIFVAPVRDVLWVAATAVCAWAALCAGTFHTPYSTAASAGGPPQPFDAIDPTSHIADERLVYLRMSGARHPVALSSYREHIWVQGGRYLSGIASADKPHLYLDGASRARLASPPLPLRAEYRGNGVAYVGAMGLISYVAQRDMRIVDRFGLSEPLSSHQRRLVLGRPGHEKDLPVAWIIAAYTPPDTALPKGVREEDVRAARHALTCGSFPELINAAQRPLTVGRFFSNIGHSFTLYGFRFPTDPIAAERGLCP